MSKLSVIARAVAVFNALHNEKFTEAKAESFMSCLEMVKAQQQEVPQLHAEEGEALLNAVGRAVAANQPIDLIYDGKTIHIDPAMTLADAFAHAEYVLKLNDRFPAGGEPWVQLAGRGTRPVVPQEVLNSPADPTPDLQKLMARAVEEPELTERQKEVMDLVQEVRAPQLGHGMRMMQGKTVDALTLDHAAPDDYEPLESGQLHLQQRDETIEDVVKRLHPLAPLRAKISGLVITLQPHYTTQRMIAEVHRRVSLGLSDVKPGSEKRLELAEEELSDGTLRTDKRCWRQGYLYRLDVIPHDRTEMAEYHIHLKERPTQGWMEPHLQLMYDKKARVFLNMTNGFDRYEQLTHFYCTAAGRKATAELAKIEDTLLAEYQRHIQNRGGDEINLHGWKPTGEAAAIAQRNADNDAKPAYYSEEWEDQDSGWRVKYWETQTGKWRYTYFATRPGALATTIRNQPGKPASVEPKPTTAPK